jgi:hypothetical protein
MVLAGAAAGMGVALLLKMPERWTAPPGQWLATVREGGPYHPFGPTGAAIELAALLALIVLAWLLRRPGDVVARLSTAAATGFVLALLVWWTIIFPVHVELSAWGKDIPADLADYRLRWEIGQAVKAGLQSAGLIALLWAVLMEPAPPPQDGRPAQ